MWGLSSLDGFSSYSEWTLFKNLLEPVIWLAWSILTFIPFWIIHRFSLRRWFLVAFVLSGSAFSWAIYLHDGEKDITWIAIIFAPLIAFAIAPPWTGLKTFPIQ
jgi:8-oxo-dGTP pyrophosphatase MutT (NUDIX family)